MKIPKVFPGISALAVLLLAAPGACSAMSSIEIVTRDRAKILGMEVRSDGYGNVPGNDVVRIELEFETKGKLEKYTHVDLEIHGGGKLLSSSTLKEDPSKPGHVIFGFAADRTELDKFTLRVVAWQGGNRVGYEIRVKDFVDPAAVPQRGSPTPRGSRCGHSTLFDGSLP